MKKPAVSNITALIIVTIIGIYTASAIGYSIGKAVYQTRVMSGCAIVMEQEPKPEGCVNLIENFYMQGYFRENGELPDDIKNQTKNFILSIKPKEAE